MFVRTCVHALFLHIAKGSHLQIAALESASQQVLELTLSVDGRSCQGCGPWVVVRQVEDVSFESVQDFLTSLLSLFWRLVFVSFRGVHLTGDHVREMVIGDAKASGAFVG